MADRTLIASTSTHGSQFVNNVVEPLKSGHGEMKAMAGQIAELGSTIGSDTNMETVFGISTQAGATALRDRVPGALIVLGTDDLSGYDANQLRQYIQNLRDIMNATMFGA